MKKLEDLIKQMVASYGHRAIPITIPFEVEGKTINFHGKSRSIIPADKELIELWTPDSTPREGELRKEASAEIKRAVERLISEGIPFFTILRSSWAVPAIEWTIE